MPRAARAPRQDVPFEQKLVLNQYLLSRFCAQTFAELAEGLKEPEYEERDEENRTRLATVLMQRCARWEGADPPGPTADRLRAYDERIVAHTDTISAQRGERIRWKYFQYLALLFTEMYLDEYFDHPTLLLERLNARVAAFNADKEPRNQVKDFVANDLRKLAFWMATGSGKTLLMHVNLLQFRDYLERHGQTGELNRIILLTPNEGLSAQHREEFAKSGIAAEIFQKEARSLFTGHMVEILDVNKLDETSGDKTVAVDAFEGNNLVLVDEGHRGAAGDAWKARRDRLCRDGFSFEYSATFGQAVRAASGTKQVALTNEYAKCILFDYSYKYFYGDGYGKEYQIVNLPDTHEENRQAYLVAGLLAFYQQQRYFLDHQRELQPYGIERPLWVFVGSSVTKQTNDRDRSDTQEILHFLARFARERAESIALLDMLASGRTPFHIGSRDIFADKFPYIVGMGMTGAALYDAILGTFFNATGGARMHLRAISGAEGEIEASLGNNPAFGVINIGAARDFLNLYDDTDDPAITVDPARLGESLFDALNAPASRVNLLVGSRKFTEGWNSWRVSAMGLMNVGRNEGTQIIQLFGRGVRLWGLDGSLKRSMPVPAGAPIPPPQIGIAETLNVYGVRADYMDRFKEYLRAEGLPTNDDEREITVPVRTRIPAGTLKMVRLKNDETFAAHGPGFDLGGPPDEFRERKIPLDWYTKLEIHESKAGSTASALPNETTLGPLHLAFLDFDRLYFDLVAYKRARGWHAMRVTKAVIQAVLEDGRWYTLKAPPDALRVYGDDLRAKRQQWQEMALALLKKYCDRYYKMKQEEFESTRREYRMLDEADTNFFPVYTFDVREEQQGIIATLEKTIAALETDTFSREHLHGLELFDFTRHLYYPLVCIEGTDVKVKPVALNKDEMRFVDDLAAYYLGRQDQFKGRELYLLRNLTRGKGVGFFEAGNFYPDFIMWLVDGTRQYITFVDPKGIVHLNADSPKLLFYETVKAVETRLSDETVILNSFIIAGTSYDEVKDWMTKDAFAERHVFFLKEDSKTYIGKMFDSILHPSTAPTLS